MQRGSTYSPAPVAGAGFVALDILLASDHDGRMRRRAGGTCGNVLAILSFLGFDSVAIARLGTDRAADVLISDLQSVGVDCQHMQRDSSATTPRVVEILPNSPGGAHHFAFTCPMCRRRFPRRSEPRYEQARESIEKVSPSLLFFDRFGSTTLRLASKAREAGAVIMFEPDSFGSNNNFDAALQISDVVKYSAHRIGKSIEPWLRKSGARPSLVIETMDGGGLRYMTRRGIDDLMWSHQGPFVVRGPSDQAGAGDWCSVGLITRILTTAKSQRWRERTVRRALAFGQALAAASILFEGPRGYLEKRSRGTILRAALSTIRRGQLPEWIGQDTEITAEPLLPVDESDVCVLCLSPNPPKEGVGLAS